MQQLLGEQHAPSLCHGDGRGAEMTAEQPAELPFAHAQAFGQHVDAPMIEGTTLDQGERARDRRGGAAPCSKIRRAFRPASQAGAEAGLLSRGRRWKEDAVFRFRSTRRADGTAIDPG